MYTLEQMKQDRSLWKNLDVIPIQCSWCQTEFEIKYGTLYNVIRRDAEGIYCGRKCAGAARAFSTQNKYKEAGGKFCKRCGEFKELSNFSILPNPPYLRAECRRCHNYKPARQYSLNKEKALRAKIPFTLSMDQFLDFWNKPCFYCGTEVKTIRLETLDFSAGFVRNNVTSICRECQKFKNGMNHDEFMHQCQKIVDNIRKK